MNRLKEMRNRKSLTQYELGRLIGKYQSRIWQLEHDYSLPRQWEKEAIAKVLMVDLKEIFPETT
jgi:DNA-binding XRE family transcriptional regulator